MGSDKRPIIKLRSTAGTGYTYVTTKNKTNTRERIELKSTIQWLESMFFLRKNANY